MKKHKILVYGSLRRGIKENEVRIFGYRMFDLGSFPGVKYTGEMNESIVVEKCEVTDAQLKAFDEFEGYDPDHPVSSFYLRRNFGISTTDYELYVYNQDVTSKNRVVSGDWLKHTGESEGCNTHMWNRFDEEEVVQ